MKLKKLMLSALFAALTCVATFVVRIPSPLGGYINLGDCTALLCGWLLGPFYGFLAAGVGSAVADLSAGYVAYAPATFLIKGLVALVAFYLLKVFSRREKIGLVLSCVAAEIVMIAGYYIYEGFIYGFVSSLVNIPANGIQALAGIICALLLYKAIRKRLYHFFE